MPETLKICKYNVSGTGYCDIFDDYCHEGPCSHETLVEYVAVVRCRECKRWQRHSEVNRDYGDCRRYSSTMRYDDFCSQGERRTDNENR